jgi:predicted nucleotide-binding protein
VKNHIRDVADGADVTDDLAWAGECEILLSRGKNVLKSIIFARTSRGSDKYLDDLAAQVDELRILTVIIGHHAQLPSGRMMSRDSLAISQGLCLAPHQEVIAQAVRVDSAKAQLRKLDNVCQYLRDHILRVDSASAPSLPSGARSKVFIGHGAAPDWMKLKNFIQDRLGLPWDEFSRVPVAGQTNTDRLISMLDEAAVALIVMTAEDESLDGTRRARENVVHEAGLFQSRLGFHRAIVLLEYGCNEFSNINGLGQIRFPKGSIEAAYEEVRRFLEREGLL